MGLKGRELVPMWDFAAQEVGQADLGSLWSVVFVRREQSTRKRRRGHLGMTEIEIQSPLS